MALKLATDSIEDRNFYGQTWANPPTIDPATGRYRMESGSGAIDEAIQNLCSTLVGELPMNEDQGVDAEAQIFESAVASVDILPITFADALKRYEKRISNVTSTGSYDKETGVVKVNIFFRERSSGVSRTAQIVNTVNGEDTQ